MFCHNCGYNLGNSKFCPKCGTKVALEETTSIKKEDQIQTGSTSNTIVVLEKKEQSPVTKFLRLSIVWILKAIAYFLYGIAILGGIVYITEKAFLDCFIVLFVLGGGGWFCHFIARKISGITPEKKKKQKLNRTQIILLIIALICAVLCAVIVTSTDECENGHQWQAATLEKPYTCSTCGATRGEPAQPCSECEMTGLIACDNCDELGQTTCSVCNGEKLADCPDCKGSGKVSCASCTGSGKGGVEESRCYKCGGHGQVKSTCSNCGGVGSVVIRSYGNTSVDDCLKCGGKGSVYNECTSCDGDGTKKSFKKCNQCDGSGSVKDEQCNGKGKVPCTNCNDNGIEECHLCKKTKQLTCNNCGGTGLIQNTPVFSVTLTAFNLEENNNRTVNSSIPSSSSYLHYKFKFESLESGKTYTLRHRTQWPGQEATLADWVWEDVKDGDIRGCEWKNGYTTSSADTLVIEILNDETGEVLGKFEMEVKQLVQEGADKNLLPLFMSPYFELHFSIISNSKETTFNQK